MDAYKPPQADLEEDEAPDFKPIRALVYGLLVAIVATLVASMIEGFIFAFFHAGLNEEQLYRAFAESYSFLITDTLLTVSILYLAGVVVKTYAARRAILFAGIVSAITLAVMVPLILLSSNKSQFPLWYNITISSAIVWAILLGASSFPGKKL